jgi:hypothetical protein
MSNTHPSPEPSPGELLGQLAEELVLLVRNDLEVSAAHRGPELRRYGLEIAWTLVVSVAAVMALFALTYAAIAGLSRAIPTWAAALVLAGVWAAVAGLLLRIDHPRRLVMRLAAETRGDAVTHAAADRDAAEQTMRATAERFAEAVAREASARELRAPIERAEHLLKAAESETDDLLRSLAATLLAPGKAGLNLLEVVTGRRVRLGDDAPGR